MGPPFIGDESAVFLSLNRNKKSVALDHSRPLKDRTSSVQLVTKADVLLEDLGPGEAEKLGLGYDTLREAQPQACVLCYQRVW